MIASDGAIEVDDDSHDEDPPSCSSSMATQACPHRLSPGKVSLAVSCAGPPHEDGQRGHQASAARGGAGGGGGGGEDSCSVVCPNMANAAQVMMPISRILSLLFRPTQQISLVWCCAAPP